MTWERLNRISTAVNRFLGGGDEPVCSRVYVNARLWGGFWLPLMWAINLAFLPWERRHVTRAYARRK